MLEINAAISPNRRESAEITPIAAGERMLRFPEVKAKVGLSRTAIYMRVSEGTFPRPYSLGANSIAWRESEVNAWIGSLQTANTEAK